MTDALNNTLTVNVCGQDREMRATFKAIRAIENALGKPWAELGQMSLTGQFGYHDVTTIVLEGLKGNEAGGVGDTRLSYEQIGEDIVQRGFGYFVDISIIYISMGFKGTKQVAGDPKEPAAQGA